MLDLTPQNAPAFRRLRRALIVRRLRRLDPVLRLELALLGGLGAAGIAWQARLPLDRLARSGGPAAVAAALAAGLGACAAIGGLVVCADHVRRLGHHPTGPEWLALPIPPRTLAGQSAWESGLHALWVLPLALGLLAALPLRARRVWALRVAVVAAAAAVTALLLALVARPLETGARAQLVVALALATLLIGILGVTYGVTLFPRVETAQRLVLLWLALALAASAMFPLAGWVLLLGALTHALGRLRARVTLAADVAAGEV